MTFDFEADRQHAAMHGYEPAESAIPMLLRCGAHQHGDVPNQWDLQSVLSRESATLPSPEVLPVAESGARPDARPLADDPTMAGG
jgi:hypothetical protein